MSTQQICDAIPHRKPMLLIDEVVRQDEQAIVCRKTFHSDEFFFQGHYPDNPLVPGVILCECAAQSGAILLSSRTQGHEGIPVLTRMNDVKFRKIIRPGDTIEIEVQLGDQVSNAFYLDARVTCEGKLAARLNLACALAPPE